MSGKNKKIIRYVLLGLFIILIVVLTIVFAPKMYRIMRSEEEQEIFKSKIENMGFKGALLLILIQIVQMVVAFIPGEPIELVAGVLYGGINGMLLCLIGSLIGTIIIYYCVKYFKNGFMKPKEEDSKRFKFLQDEERLDFIVFILFFIPGTPKDALTYIVPFTKMKAMRFFIIATLARIPSIITSTFVGSMVFEGNYKMAIILFVITGIISILGILINHLIIKKKNEKNKCLNEEKDLKK